MNISFNLTLHLSDSDKAWILEHVVTPISIAIQGVTEAVSSRQEMIQAIQAMQARVDQIETPNPEVKP